MLQIEPAIDLSSPDRVAFCNTAAARFYRGYGWCLNAYPTFPDAMKYLNSELQKLEEFSGLDWQRRELMTNVYLLSCGLLNAADDFLRGPSVKLPYGIATALKQFIEFSARRIEQLKQREDYSAAQQWRDSLSEHLRQFLKANIAGSEVKACTETVMAMSRLMSATLPRRLRERRLSIPSPFRRLELSEHDIVDLANAFLNRFPDRAAPLAVIGIRTSGSYFSPLISACLENAGFRDVECLTIDPLKGPSPGERRRLIELARSGYKAVLTDDPPDSGSVIRRSRQMLLDLGFGKNLVLLLPIAETSRVDLAKIGDAICVPKSLWYKRRVLDNLSGDYLAEVFELKGAKINVRRRASDRRQFRKPHSLAGDNRAARIKEIFDIEIGYPDGRRVKKAVLAKGVAWGWYGYHAVLIGLRLSKFVPPFLGYRDGFSFSEFISEDGHDGLHERDRGSLVSTLASYVAARATSLPLSIATNCNLDLGRQNNGIRVMAKTLSGAFGRLGVSLAARHKVQRMLGQQTCRRPTLIDGKMDSDEWIRADGKLFKTDYEQHGLGKTAVNFVDPAFDLADACLQFNLSRKEEAELIDRYVAQSADSDVSKRLYFNKVAAGLWAMNRAQDDIFGGRPNAEAAERFMAAWNFLTIHSAYHFGGMCRVARNTTWQNRILFCDIDGVLDRRPFGFPSTSEAGIKAISILNTAPISTALNTARSVEEVAEYCRAYHLAGGVAEYGAFIWDAISERGKSLVSQECMEQLSRLRSRLKKIPGVYLDDRHKYSVRAFVFKQKSTKRPLDFIRNKNATFLGDAAVMPLDCEFTAEIVAKLGLDSLCVRQTTIDTTFSSKDLDKGTGLVALRNWCRPNAETFAIGDHESDLPMFKAADRSFAPANFNAPDDALRHGCKIARQKYQNGLLQIVLREFGDAARLDEIESDLNEKKRSNVMLQLLAISDQSDWRKLSYAMLDGSIVKYFFHPS